MRKYFQKLFLFSVCPLFILALTIVPYVYVDPYMDFGKKLNYSWIYHFQSLGDLSTKKLINSDIKYNSFIFGSSRTVGLYACYLNGIIPNSFFFHYANWNESIGGIENKLELIDSLGYRIANAIIYLDTDFTFKGSGECLKDDHYLVTKEGAYGFLINHFKGFYKHLTADKLKILLGFKVNGEIFPNWDSDLITNDPKHKCDDPNILLNYSFYDNSRELINSIDSLKITGFIYKRSLIQQFKENQISESEKDILLKIKNIFNQHSTHYYVIITPLYDQLKFSITDQNILNEVFGNKLYDFSGINRITNNEYNYPDRKHFQPYISKFMLDSIICVSAQN